MWEYGGYGICVAFVIYNPDDRNRSFLQRSASLRWRNARCSIFARLEKSRCPPEFCSHSLNEHTFVPPWFRFLSLFGNWGEQVSCPRIPSELTRFLLSKSDFSSRRNSALADFPTSLPVVAYFHHIRLPIRQTPQLRIRWLGS